MIIRFFLILCFWLVSFTTAQAAENFAKNPEVQNFISYMVKKYHFKRSELVAVFSHVKVRPKVIQCIKAPLEQKPWRTYQMLFVTEWRIHEGVKFWNQYRNELEKAEKMFGVPANIIVATIGIETKYGHSTGEYPVIDALTNIGFSGSSRAPYFRHELEEFLLLSREQHLNPLKVMGSYAGAIGQPQFMPSSYRDYAVNFSGSGKIDLSHNEADIIGSIANYYKKHGWQTGEAVAVPASMHGGKYLINWTGPRNISTPDLLESGVALHSDEKYKVIQLQGYYGNEYWLGFHNFDVIKRYNSSDLYAMAVYQLSYYISVLREKTHNGTWT